MKLCKDCGVLPVLEKRHKGRCRDCFNKKKREYANRRNAELRALRPKTTRIKTCKRCGTQTAEKWHGKLCWTCRAASCREQYSANPDYRDARKAEATRYRRTYSDVVKNKDRDRGKLPHRREQDRNYKSRPEVRARTNERELARLYSNPLARLHNRISTLVRQTFKNRGHRKPSKVESVLGCSIEYLRFHLETTFLFNYGVPYTTEEVHIDHIVPISRAQTEDELLRLSHYTNLQWLLVVDNLRKSNHTMYNLTSIAK